MGEGKSQEIYNSNYDQRTAWTEGLVRALQAVLLRLRTGHENANDYSHNKRTRFD